MKSFREEYQKQIWIEVFLIDGMNSIPADVQKIACILEEIKPDRIHLNTAVRPPAEDFVTPLSNHDLNQLTAFFIHQQKSFRISIVSH